MVGKGEGHDILQSEKTVSSFPMFGKRDVSKKTDGIK